MQLSGIERDGQSGYYLDVNGHPHHLTGGDVDLPGLRCDCCGREEEYTEEGDCRRKLYSDEAGGATVALCSCCLTGGAVR